jgi:hypothetical protein
MIPAEGVLLLFLKDYPIFRVIVYWILMNQRCQDQKKSPGEKSPAPYKVYI